MMTRHRSPFTDLNRLREILQILVRHGFGMVISQLNLMAYLPWRTRKSALKASRPLGPDDARRTTPERVRLMLEDLGPVYIKLGQTLSMRPDILPPDYIAELSKLQ